MVNNKSSSCIGMVDSSCRKCVVSLMYDGTSLAKCLMFSSTYSDNFSVIDPILLTIGHPGLFALCIFGRV